MTHILRRCAHFVEDHADHIRIVRGREQTGRHFHVLVQLLRRSVARRGDQNDLGIQCAGDLHIDACGVSLASIRHQAFHDHHVRVACALLIEADDPFHQQLALLLAH